jgi:hypothetical protein
MQCRAGGGRTRSKIERGKVDAGTTAARQSHAGERPINRLTKPRSLRDPGGQRDLRGGDAILGRTACPLCGERRVGAFRYCRRCEFDFEPDHGQRQVPVFTLGAPSAPAAERTRKVEAVPSHRLHSPSEVSDGGMTALPEEPRSIDRAILVLIVVSLVVGAICAILVVALQ